MASIVADVPAVEAIQETGSDVEDVEIIAVSYPLSVDYCGLCSMPPEVCITS